MDRVELERRLREAKCDVARGEQNIAHQRAVIATVLIIFVPVIDGLWYLIECGFLRGSEGHNKYGHDPLERY